jgi:predicted small secreted protein
MKLFILSFTAMFALFGLSACNTMVGIGQDTRLLGEGLEKTARKAAPNDGYDSGSSGAPIY